MKEKKLIISLIILVLLIIVGGISYFMFFNKKEEKSFFEQISDMGYSVKVTEYSYVSPSDYRWEQGEQLDIYIHGNEIEPNIKNVLLINNVIASANYEDSNGSLPIAFPSDDKTIWTIGCISIFKNNGITIEVKPSKEKNKESVVYSDVDALFEKYCMPVIDEG